MEMKGGKERVSKQKLLKECYQGQNVTVLAILECVEFKSFHCRPLHFEIHFTGPENMERDINVQI